MSVRLTLTGLAAACAVAGCLTEAPSPGAVPEDLASLTVADESFTFATARTARLRLEPMAASPAEAQLVQVTDSEGRRLFAGVVLDPISLDLQLSNASSDTLTVTTGQGPDSVSRTVSLTQGDGSVRF